MSFSISSFAFAHVKQIKFPLLLRYFLETDKLQFFKLISDVLKYI